ncbi:P-loop containing nucleoside triphosphate hydrolase protein [Gymnopus androsaceus JB14]|uniref:Kinesin-like protein n=1 Tax=Gymnopus androsaceus JB14 TaxID=1447944 RepID=A0A6A4GUU2_9AGAR|nr:P-loop containing nucleoside triphosphate hydrolase protein [Gymnopus androsaceus JB14]
MDFSIRISYIELYNKELRDLLANDLAAPIRATQPVGMTFKDATKNGCSSNIKIFDDANKQGVVIQGIEEIPVKSSADAPALLTKGIILTPYPLTMHTKEAGVMGEDLLRIGKLNMVDLAGSENIGRSGAESKRAREAGMINQSLLTLGRVINALVKKAQHVPHCESKLTHILQDSLEGRTKTSIIATVSPAHSNLEETLLTLDYAMSARSIRNKPEINQCMTRNSLLKEYNAEIKRLKVDILATREKNSIFSQMRPGCRWMRKPCKHMHKELYQTSSQTFSKAHAAVKGIHGILEHVLQETAQFFERKQKTLVKASNIVQQSTESEVE